MDLSTVAAIVVPLITGFIGILLGVNRMGRMQESWTRDIADSKERSVRAQERLDAHDARLVALETGRAVDEERWKRLEDTLQEVRDDVKALRAART